MRGQEIFPFFSGVPLPIARRLRLSILSPLSSPSRRLRLSSDLPIVSARYTPAVVLHPRASPPFDEISSRRGASAKKSPKQTTPTRGRSPRIHPSSTRLSHIRNIVPSALHDRLWRAPTRYPRVRLPSGLGLFSRRIYERRKSRRCTQKSRADKLRDCSSASKLRSLSPESPRKIGIRQASPGDLLAFAGI